MKGYIIDCKYVVRVRDLMKAYPRPRKRTKYLQGDGELLPLIVL